MEFFIVFCISLWLTESFVISFIIAAVVAGGINVSKAPDPVVAEPTPVIRTVADEVESKFDYGFGAANQYCKTMMEQHFTNTSKEQRDSDMNTLGVTVIAQTYMGGDPVHCMSDGTVK